MGEQIITGKETITAWLDHKKIPLRKRDVYKDHIEILAGAIDEGFLILNEDKSLTQKLRFPLKGGMVKRDIETLTLRLNGFGMLQYWGVLCCGF